MSTHLNPGHPRRGPRRGPLLAVLSVLIAALTMFACDRDTEVEPRVDEDPYSQSENTGNIDNENIEGPVEEGFGENPYFDEDDDEGLLDDESMSPPSDPMGTNEDNTLDAPITDEPMGTTGESGLENYGELDEPGSVNEDDLVQNDPLVDERDTEPSGTAFEQPIDDNGLETSDSDLTAEVDENTPINGESPESGVIGTAEATGDSPVMGTPGAVGEDDSEVVGESDEPGMIGESDEPGMIGESDEPTQIGSPVLAEGSTRDQATPDPTLMPSTSGLCGEAAIPPRFHEALVLDYAQLDDKLRNNVTTTINSPAAGDLVEGNQIEVQLDVTGFDIAANERLVQVLIDGEPVDELLRLTSGPLTVDLTGHDLKPGAHVLAVFPVRPWGEIAGDVSQSGAMVPFYFQEKTGELADANAPMISLVSPVGQQQVAANSNRVLFSLATHNIELGEQGHKLRMTLDQNAPVELTHNVPVWIAGLPSGEHTVKFEVLGNDGNVIEGPGTTVERVFDVRTTSQTAFVDEPVEDTQVDDPIDDSSMGDDPIDDEMMIDKPVNDGAANTPY